MLSSSDTTTTAPTRSPYVASGIANTAASMTPLHPARMASTCSGEIFSPPRLMMFLMRPVRNRYPSSSTEPRSPVRNHPSAKLRAVPAGLAR